MISEKSILQFLFQEVFLTLSWISKIINENNIFLFFNKNAIHHGSWSTEMDFKNKNSNILFN